MSEPHFLRLDQANRQRWRNDGGWTREIARAGDADNWQWRLSIAEVESDGPFSRFPGIEREIVLLNGAGMALDFGEGEVAMLSPESPRLRFAGERAIDSRLIDGPTTDFNLMWARAQVEAELWLRPLVGAVSLFAEPGETWVMHQVAGESRWLDAGGVHLAAGDTAILADDGQRRRQRIDATGSGILIRLRARPGG